MAPSVCWHHLCDDTLGMVATLVFLLPPNISGAMGFSNNNHYGMEIAQAEATLDCYDVIWDVILVSWSIY